MELTKKEMKLVIELTEMLILSPTSFNAWCSLHDFTTSERNEFSIKLILFTSELKDRCRTSKVEEDDGA